VAIATVKATKLTGGTTTASGSVSATAGNALFAAGGVFNSGSWSAARTGDTFTTDTNGSAASIGVGIASAPNVVGGAVTLTVTSSGAGGCGAHVAEISGLPTSAIRDATSPAIASGSSASATTGSLTNATADAIYLAVFADSFNSSTCTFTPTGGWSDVIGGVTMKEPDNVAAQAYDVAYLIVSSTAARTANETVDSSPWTCGIAVYKAAASAAVIPPAGPWPRLMPLLAGPI
jgi:hypothetical protein